MLGFNVFEKDMMSLLIVFSGLLVNLLDGFVFALFDTLHLCPLLVLMFALGVAFGFVISLVGFWVSVGVL